VKRKELVNLGILNVITPFSYESRTGKTVYLEEDEDMDTFWKAYIAKTGQKPECKILHQENIFVRKLPSFSQERWAGIRSHI